MFGAAGIALRTAASTDKVTRDRAEEIRYKGNRDPPRVFTINALLRPARALVRSRAQPAGCATHDATRVCQRK